MPDWTAASVERPISVRGPLMSIRVSRAALEASASIEISIPGEMIPPRYSPAADLVEAGDRDGEPVGAELVRVLEQDRHPGLRAGSEDQRLAVQIPLEHVA